MRLTDRRPLNKSHFLIFNRNRMVFLTINKEMNSWFDCSTSFFMESDISVFFLLYYITKVRVVDIYNVGNRSIDKILIVDCGFSSNAPDYLLFAIFVHIQYFRFSVGFFIVIAFLWTIRKHSFIFQSLWNWIMLGQIGMPILMEFNRNTVTFYGICYRLIVYAHCQHNTQHWNR